MNVIRFSSPDVIGFLGGNQLKVDNRKYRYNKFLVKTEYSKDEQVWYNAFTGSVISIRYIEIDSIFEDYPADYIQFLIQNYFLVPENFDEESLLHMYRERHQKPITCNSLDCINSYTILTTTQCNARCFYCYQNVDHNKHHMTEQTARDVVKFIDKHTWGGQDVFLGWFGGEPLYNQKVIDIITYGVLSTGRKVYGSMISNGYLMNKELATKAVNEWHIDGIQITLDGTEEVYNKTKKYIYKDDPNPFITVIRNIHYMLEAGMRVSIRLNCGIHNVNDLKNLIIFLSREFEERQSLTVYVHELFDLKNNRSDDDIKIIFENMMEIEDLLSENNFRIDYGGAPESIKTMHCMVDANDAVVISPSGELGLCEHYQNSKFYSHINNPEIKDIDVIKRWRVKSEYTEICEDCPLKPICMKLVDCPDHKICSKWEKEYFIKRCREDIKLIYNNWQKKMLEECEDNKCNCKKSEE